MKCMIRRQASTGPGRVTVTLQRDNCTVVFKEVPADDCEICGEYYLSEQVTRELLAHAETAARSGTEVEILRYAARQAEVTGEEEAFLETGTYDAA